MMTPSASCGHVFIMHCNAAGLAADAILVPVRDAANAPPLGCVRALTSTEAAELGHVGVATVFEGQVTTRLYHTESEAVHGTMKVVRAYLSAAGKALKGQASGFRRKKPLVALAMPGVGLMDESVSANYSRMARGRCMVRGRWEHGERQMGANANATWMADANICMRMRGWLSDRDWIGSPGLCADGHRLY